MGLHTIFNVKINIDLLQCNPHAWALNIGKHYEFDVGRRLIIMEFVLTGTIGHKAEGEGSTVSTSLFYSFGRGTEVCSHLSSSPPNLRTIFRREKTVPKISLASSSVVREG